MSARKDRLKKLVEVQEQLKALHEARRARFLADAATAEAEAEALAQRFDEAGSLSALFPELYYRRISGELARRDANLEDARREAGMAATATARTTIVERAYRHARDMDERQRADRERLELIEQKRKAE